VQRLAPAADTGSARQRQPCSPRRADPPLQPDSSQPPGPAQPDRSVPAPSPQTDRPARPDRPVPA